MALVTPKILALDVLRDRESALLADFQRASDRYHSLSPNEKDCVREDHFFLQNSRFRQIESIREAIKFVESCSHEYPQ